MSRVTGARGRIRRSIGCLAAVLITSACHRSVSSPAPPRVDTPAALPNETSSVVVPVGASLDDVERALERETPRKLWSIDQQLDRCVPAQRVNFGIGKVKLVPDLGCRIVGKVERGRIRLGGTGDRITITMPVNATIAARKVGGIVSKTATGSAVMHAVARMSLAGDWAPVAKVSIDYDWSQPPGIDFLGQRIAFASKADERLKPVIVGLEKSLPRELAKLNLHDRLADVWREGFTSIMLNRDNPPVWLRLTPRRLGFGGYRIRNRRLEMVLAASALTETFVGNRPPDPTPTPLPPPAKVAGEPGLRFFFPVLADYSQLEPVVHRALAKLAAKGITLAGIGPVDAQFGDVTIYATTGGHLAVGVKALVRKHGSSLISTKGEVWLTAIPYNAPNSQLIRARDVSVASDTDSSVANLLVALFNNTSVRESIRDGLTHDFAPDYQRVLMSARRAIGSRREGDFMVSANVTDVQNGAIKVTGQGLFLPVRAFGRADVVYDPG